jgi:hypothetical protein
MSNRLVLAAVLLACAGALEGQQTFYQIDLNPSGMMLSSQPPQWRGTTLVFKRFPDSTLMSVRKSDVRKISQVSRDAALESPADQVVQIGNLAMQGGASQAGATNASAVGARKAAPAKPSGPALGEGFYSNLVVGQSVADPNSANDYAVGRTYAGPPPNAVQASPGSPPTMPSATSGQNPPQ